MRLSIVPTRLNLAPLVVKRATFSLGCYGDSSLHLYIASFFFFSRKHNLLSLGVLLQDEFEILLNYFGIVVCCYICDLCGNINNCNIFHIFLFFLLTGVYCIPKICFCI